MTELCARVTLVTMMKLPVKKFPAVGVRTAVYLCPAAIVAEVRSIWEFPKIGDPNIVP